jgi:hypothetical protein
MRSQRQAKKNAPRFSSQSVPTSEGIFQTDAELTAIAYFNPHRPQKASARVKKNLKSEKPQR